MTEAEWKEAVRQRTIEVEAKLQQTRKSLASKEATLGTMQSIFFLVIVLIGIAFAASILQMAGIIPMVNP
jgi:hypothetical protein